MKKSIMLGVILLFLFTLLAGCNYRNGEIDLSISPYVNLDDSLTFDDSNEFVPLDDSETLLSACDFYLANEDYDHDEIFTFEFYNPPQDPITRNDYDIPPQSPHLYLSLNTGDFPAQNFRAAQGTTSWFFFFEASGFHPLCFWTESQDCIDFSEFIGQLEEAGSSDNKIQLQFSHFPPDTVMVRRWRTEFIGMSSEMWNRYELVEVNDNIIFINDTGYDYIYEVEALWGPNDNMSIGARAFYTFRINSVR